MYSPYTHTRIIYFCEFYILHNLKRINVTSVLLNLMIPFISYNSGNINIYENEYVISLDEVGISLNESFGKNK